MTQPSNLYGVVKVKSSLEERISISHFAPPTKCVILASYSVAPSFCSSRCHPHGGTSSKREKRKTFVMAVINR